MTTALSAEQRLAVEETTGARVVGVERAGTGGSRLTLLVDLDGPPGAVVVRAEGDGAFTGTELDLAREAAVYRALDGSGVPVARLLAVAESADALVLERLPGSDELAGRPADELAAIMDALADALGRLHRLDPGDLALPFAAPATASDHARLDLAMWRRLADRFAPARDPLARWVEGWLWANPPASVERTCLVQGDTGPGNLIADGPVLTGLVDWEMAHLGDPIDDLAWVRFRCEGLDVDLDRFERRWSDAAGVAVDAAALAYYGLAVPYRCYVISAIAAARGGGARGHAPYLLVAQRFLDRMAGEISALTGVDEAPPPLPPDDRTIRTPWFDQLVETLRAGARAIDDPDTAARVRDAQILVHVLRQHDRLGDRLDAAETADATRVLGVGPDDPKLAEAAEAAGRRGGDDVLRYLMRRRVRDHERWRTILERERTRR